MSEREAPSSPKVVLMNPKRLFAFLSALLFLGALAPAQDEVEIAYRILSGYVDKKEAQGATGARIAGGILSASGGLMLGAAATTWFAGDRIAAASGASLDPDLKSGLTIGLGVSGLGLTGLGVGFLAAKPHDYHAEYAEVFREADPRVREALSVAALRELALKGKSARVTGALSSLLVPALTVAIQAGTNLTKGKVWYDHALDSLSWSAWSIAGGITGLFGTSEEERLYAKYLAGRDAIYGESP